MAVAFACRFQPLGDVANRQVAINLRTTEAQALIAGGLDNVRWDLLPDAAKGPKVWAALARRMGPQALRINLNTLLRHNVFSVEQLSSTAHAGSEERLGKSFYTDYVADRIADESDIRRSKQFPYQYFSAYLNGDDNVPQKTRERSTTSKMRCIEGSNL